MQIKFKRSLYMSLGTLCSAVVNRAYEQVSLIAAYALLLTGFVFPFFLMFYLYSV